MKMGKTILTVTSFGVTSGKYKWLLCLSENILIDNQCMKTSDKKLFSKNLVKI